MSTPPVIELLADDLTPDGEIHCPHPKAGMKLWNTHPRVFLKLSFTGQVRCPYCSTQYHVAAEELTRHGSH